MIRLTLLWIFVASLAAYAFKDWFKSLCGLILLLAVVEHPDFPKSIVGIQGLNPWNLLLFVIIIAWLAARREEGLHFDFPKGVAWLLGIYFAIIILAFVRFVIFPDMYYEYLEVVQKEMPSIFNKGSEYIINCFKWVIPGILLYDGCRDEKRTRLALYTIVTVYVLLAIQVIRWVPIGYLRSGDELQARALKIIMNEVGFHRVNVSMMLAGATWALYCVRDIAESKLVRNLLLLGCAITFFGMSLTGGRMGYVTWVVLGGMFAVLRWRRLLFFGPAVVVVFILAVPAVQERFVAGFTPDTVDTNIRLTEMGYQDGDGPDLYTVTSGRAFAWPFVIDEIAKKPLIGYGREAMLRTGLGVRIWRQYGESFPHPHNAYLQWLHDNGILGFIPVMLFYILAMTMSMRLFVNKDDATSRAVGGVALALTGALLVAAMGSQTFYPREGSLPMWCALGLALRCYVLRTAWLKSVARETAHGRHLSPVT